jgi:hypothetical protein
MTTDVEIDVQLFSTGHFFCPHLCYLMSFIHLMLCNYYIISVMIMLYYVTDVEIDVDLSGVHINRSCTDPVK